MRICSECGAIMHEGYCIDGGLFYFCSLKCLKKNMTYQEYIDLYYDESSETYWTQWEEEDILDE